MLVRSAARKQRRLPSRTLAASFAQLRLPWLAPAQVRWAASHSSQSPPTQSTRSRSRQRSSSVSPSPSQSRQLATAADLSSTRLSHGPPSGYSNAFKNNQHDNHLPWDLSRPGGGSSRVPGLVARMDPVMIPSESISAPSQLKIFADYTGTVMELLQHLHTSLLVGRPERARSIILRLVQQSTPSSPETIYAHCAYLEYCYKNLCAQLQHRGQMAATLKDMQQWFEVEIRSRGTQLDAKMLVTMIRASIKVFDGHQRDRAVRRYLALAHDTNADTFEDVRYSEYYDDEDFDAVQNVCTGQWQQHAEEGVTDQIALDSTQQTETTPLATVKEVTPTALRGSGLDGVKRAMSVLTEGPLLPADATPNERLAHAYERQRLLEDASIDIAMDRWRRADEDLRKIGISTTLQSRPIGALMWQWHQALLPALEDELAEVKKMYSGAVAKENERAAYGSYLELLPLDKVAAITILHTMGLLTSLSKASNFDVPLAKAAETLGMAIEQECAVEASSKKERQGGKKLSASQAKRLKQAISRRMRKRKAGSDGLASSFNLPNEQILAQMAWPLQVQVKLGVMLISKLMETANLPVTGTNPRTREKITQMQPAFLYRHKFERGSRQGILTPNPALTEKLDSEPLPSLLAKRMPMIVPPKLWTGFRDGGYLHYKTDILRFKGNDRSGKMYFDAAQRNGDLSQIFAGLNALGQVPWKVNRDVFDVQIEAWNSGAAIANFAPRDNQFEMPKQPDNTEDPSAKRRWLADMRRLENKRVGMHSQRCFQNFQLEVARGTLNETLYFPHNLDFRGRAYPIPPYLNHMGADNVRALLVFAEGKPLGQRGLRWLKIHLATVAGHDKASLDDRAKYVDEHLDDIYDSVRNPLGGRRWWLQAEDAWQVLAACFELTRALDSPDPTQFISRLPIHQDGTCNGLQHYAALGGDEAGARQVNLEPGDRPSDIYSAVADAVRKEVQKDAESGNIIARNLHGHITRKVVKQPVMTNVYGVTFFGARTQVKKQLAVIFPDSSSSDEVGLNHMAHYVAEKIFKSLGEMFTGAQAIQDWLGKCATLISTCVTPDQVQKIASSQASGTSPEPKRRGGSAAKSSVHKKAKGKNDAIPRQFKSTVVWTTPLGLPVVQPYRKSASRIIKTNMAHLSLAEPQVWDPVSKRKQLQAFAPNFIHSLDSTHMLLSAVKCTEAGLTFASIHDSFWTHACDVDTLSTVLRDAFIDMHSDDIVGQLRDEFVTRYKGSMYLASVDNGTNVARKIIELRKSLKLKSSDFSELALEAERIQLLNSSDPEERFRGEAMITPGSIWQAEGKADAGFEAAELKAQQLGRVPENMSTTSKEAESGDYTGDSVFEADDDAAQDLGHEGADRSAPPRAARPAQRSVIHIWLPVDFPAVPAKGSFDVTRLRDSKYFFS